MSSSPTARPRWPRARGALRPRSCSTSCCRRRTASTCAANCAGRASTSMILLLTARTGEIGQGARPRSRRRRLRHQAVQSEGAARAHPRAAAAYVGAADVRGHAIRRLRTRPGPRRAAAQRASPCATTPLEFKLLGLFTRRARARADAPRRSSTRRGDTTPPSPSASSTTRSRTCARRSSRRRRRRAFSRACAASDIDSTSKT